MEKVLIIRDHLCYITPPPTEPTTSVGHGTTVTILELSELSLKIIMSVIVEKQSAILVVGIISRCGDDFRCLISMCLLFQVMYSVY